MGVFDQFDCCHQSWRYPNAMIKQANSTAIYQAITSKTTGKTNGWIWAIVQNIDFALTSKSSQWAQKSMCKKSTI